MCSLFGLIDHNNNLSLQQKSRITNVFGKECEVRGTDATGYAFCHDGELTIYKRPLPARKMKAHIPPGSSIIMGHTRMTTQGSEKQNRNNHPFLGKCGDTVFALAHNGVLSNDIILRKEHSLPATNIKTDSYIAVQLLEQQKALHLDSLKVMAEQLEGSFSFTVLDNGGNLYFVKGDSPLELRYYSTLGIYLYASTSEIMEKAIRRLGMHKLSYHHIDLEERELLKIEATGSIERSEFTFTSSRDYRFWDRCSYIYQGYQGSEWESYSDRDNIDLLYRYGYTEGEVQELLEWP